MHCRAGVVQICRRDAGAEQASGGIDKDVTLQAHDLLAGIISFGSAGLAGFHRLAVDDARRRRGFAPLPFAIGHDKEVVETLERSRIAPAVKMPLHGAVGWEGGGQRSPLAARAKQIQHGLQKQPQSPLTRTPRRGGTWQKRCDQRPRFIADMGLTDRKSRRSVVLNGGDGHH